MKTLLIALTISLFSFIINAERIAPQEPEHESLRIIRNYKTGGQFAGRHKSFHYIRYSRFRPREAYREAWASVARCCPEATYTVEESHYDGIKIRAFTGTITFCEVEEARWQAMVYLLGELINYYQRQ